MRHDDVAEHEIEPVGGGGEQVPRGPAVGRGHDRVPGLFEDRPDELAHGVVVLGQQHRARVRAAGATGYGGGHGRVERHRAHAEWGRCWIDSGASQNQKL
nr:hypothetical protein [Frigoriglobus tundricola]